MSELIFITKETLDKIRVHLILARAPIDLSAAACIPSRTLCFLHARATSVAERTIINRKKGEFAGDISTGSALEQMLLQRL